MSNLTKATLRGVSWNTAATVATAAMQIGYTAVMARLLPPAAFGLVALAGVVLRFGTYLAQMGLEQALVQKPDLSEADVRATFTTAIGLGTLATLVLVAAAPLAPLVLREPAVVPLIQALALSLFITGLSATAISLLRREMAFGTLALMQTVAYVVAYGGLGIGLALKGFGVWSLVAATLGQGLITAGWAYAATRHSLRLYFHWAHYRPLLRYGSRITLTSFLEFITSSLDTLLVGRLLGAAALGLYNRAWMLVTLPLYLLTNSVSRVIFPAFSQVQANQPKLRTVYLASTTLVAAGVLPVCAGVAVAAPELVRALLGPGWAAAVPVLRVMCLAVPLSLITMFAGIVCDARAALAAKIRVNLLALATLLGLFGLLHGYGLLGFATALVLNELVRTALFLHLMRQELAAPYPRLLGLYGPGLWHAAAVGGGLWLARAALLPLAWPAPALLAAQMLVGAVLLAVVALWRPAPALRHALHQLLSRLDLAASTGRAGQLLARYAGFLNRRAGYAGAESEAFTALPSNVLQP